MSNPGITGLDLRDLTAIEIYSNLIVQAYRYADESVVEDGLSSLAELAYKAADCLCEKRTRKVEKENKQ